MAYIFRAVRHSVNVLNVSVSTVESHLSECVGTEGVQISEMFGYK